MRWKKLLALPPIAVGVLALWWAMNSRPPPLPAHSAQAATPVRVVSMEPVAFVAQARGFGEVRPARVWAAIAQVSGRLRSVHPRLRNGQFIEAGALLYEINPVDYALRRAEVGAQLSELMVRESNTQASLLIERRNLDVAVREFERVTRLQASGSASQSAVDSAQRARLASEAAVQNMRNTLALIPSQRAALEARLGQVERDLANTRVTAPFAMRVAALRVEVDQYVAVGQTLFEGDSVDRVEITAQIAMSQMRRLSLTFDGAIADASAMARNIASIMGHRPRVRMPAGPGTAEWDASFLRITDGVDPSTRTIGVVVAVDEPWNKTIPGVRPPLTKGMFVEVVLQAPPSAAQLLLPAMAVRNGAVLLADDDNRLRSRNVEVLFNQDEWSVVAAGIEAGERVVVSQLVPAVEGMLLEPNVDESLQRAMRAMGAP